jgi:hypothetical protein
LRREIDIVELDGRTYRVKLALRPDGELTAKAELDDLAQASLNQAERQLVRDAVEAIAIERHSDLLPADFGKKTSTRIMAPLMDDARDENESDLDDDDDDDTYDP